MFLEPNVFTFRVIRLLYLSQVENSCMEIFFYCALYILT